MPVMRPSDVTDGRTVARACNERSRLERRSASSCLNVIQMAPLSQVLCSELKCELPELEEMLNTRKGRFEVARVTAQYNLLCADLQVYKFKDFASYLRLSTITEAKEMTFFRFPDLLLTTASLRTVKVVPMFDIDCQREKETNKPPHET